MNIPEILTQLKTIGATLPEEALKAAIEQREQMTPELLQLIKHAKENPDFIWDNPNYMGYVYAMYLLAQFLEKRAYPLIVDFLSIASEDILFDARENPYKIDGILASVCGGDDSLIKSLIENEAVCDLVRDQAMAALVTLVTCGEKSREEVIAYFQTLFRDKFKRVESMVWSDLVTYSRDLYPKELFEDIKQAYADKLVDPRFIPFKHVEHQLAVSQERVLKRLPNKYSLVNDTFVELKNNTHLFYDSIEAKVDAQVSHVMLDLMPKTGGFPREALIRAVALREHITPRLLGFIEYAEEYARGIEEIMSMLHLYALYLLAQFREKRAYPLIINFFSLPGEISLDITGDVITEDLHRILASVYDGNDALLKNLIEDVTVNQYVRDAALRTFVVLVANGQKSREEVMAYFQSLFRDKLERKESYIWGGLIICSMDLYPEEVYEDIQQVYANDWLDSSLGIIMVGFDEVKEVYQLGKEKALALLQKNHYYTLIDDTVVEMQDWASFKEAPKSQKKIEPAKSHKPKKQKPAPRYVKPREGKKIGRNEPCSCGSGKKYKKCCGA
jgi:hypothetical protein